MLARDMLPCLLMYFSLHIPSVKGVVFISFCIREKAISYPGRRRLSTRLWKIAQLKCLSQKLTFLGSKVDRALRAAPNQTVTTGTHADSAEAGQPCAMTLTRSFESHSAIPKLLERPHNSNKRCNHQLANLFLILHENSCSDFLRVRVLHP